MMIIGRLDGAVMCDGSDHSDVDIAGGHMVLVTVERMNGGLTKGMRDRRRRKHNRQCFSIDATIE
jgi:hypothetical protein